jgi:uncharacterized protein
VPWRGVDIALILGGGILLIFVSVGIVLYFLAATDSDFSIGSFVLIQVMVYGGQSLIAWYIVFRRRSATPGQAGFTWVGPGPLLLMVPALLGLVIVNVFVSLFSILLFGEVTSAKEQLIGDAETLSLETFILMAVVVVIAAPVVEEFVFRGLFFQLLRGRRSFGAAASISAAVFSISHLIPSLIPHLFVMGLILAGVVERYKSIYPAMALHALNNAFAMTVVYFTLN